MRKALFKKQLMEVFSWVIQDKKTGKKRAGKGLVSYIFLYALVFGFLGFIFYQVADMLCAPLLSVDLGWFYMTLMGLIGIMLGVFGSVFNTFTSLYQAKDNDLLLAMPIPAGSILTARLLGVYAVGLLYEMLVMIPALIVYFMYAHVGILGILFSLLIPFILSVFVLTLSCVLGWVVAWVSSRLRNQKLITVFLSLVFIAAYYYFYSNAYVLLGKILENPGRVSESVKGPLYPLYHMGLAAEGNVLSMLIFVVIILALFGIVYEVLSRSFLRLATTKRGAAKVKYVEKASKSASPGRALLRREFRRFLGSTNYMLNCGLGIVFMIIAAVALLIKQDTVTEVIFGMFQGYEEILALLAVAAICMMTTMNDMTAPSVSLEGKQIWLAQVLPVTGYQVLMAKLKMHLILTLIPTAVVTACVEWVLKPSPLFAVIIPVAVVLFVLMMACLGLVLNLKMPNLTWTSEVVPIKQSASVTFALFGGWVIVLALGVLYYLTLDWITPAAYLLCVTALLLVLSIALLSWLRTKGAKIFEHLTA